MRKSYSNRVIAILIIAWIAISGSLYAQSGSFGNTYIFSGGEMAIINVQHNFLNGGSGVLPGTVGTDRIAIQGFLSFSGTASWIGASNDAFVDGYVRTYETGTFIFPIGDNNVYRPAAVSSASTTDPANAAYFGVSATSAITSSLKGGNEPVLPSSGPFDTALKADNVVAVDNLEYWDINGTAAAKISLTWVAANSYTNLSTITILGWNGSQWVVLPSTVDTTSILGGSSTTTAGSISTNVSLLPNTYEAYTLGVLCAAGTTAPILSLVTLTNICPSTTLDLTTVTATNLPLGVSLTWHTAAIATTANKVTATALATGITYYAAFYDAVGGCYSSVSTPFLTSTTTCCSAGNLAPKLH